MEIIPAIDIIDGKCVRLTQGDFNQKTIYNENPLEVALQFESIGIKRLHLVDLDGAKQGKIINAKVLEQIASKTKLKIDFGGGIKTEADVSSVLNNGATWATIGSLAVKNSNLFLQIINSFGADKIFLGADVKNENLSVGGWLEETQINIYDFIKSNMANGITNIFCTDISKDGKLEGPSFDLYKNIIEKNPEVKLIASGGVSNVTDLINLQKINCSGAIVGKAIYEGKISMNELKTFLN